MDDAGWVSPGIINELISSFIDAHGKITNDADKHTYKQRKCRRTQENALIWHVSPFHDDFTIFIKIQVQSRALVPYVILCYFNIRLLLVSYMVDYGFSRVRSGFDWILIRCKWFAPHPIFVYEVFSSFSSFRIHWQVQIQKQRQRQHRNSFFSGSVFLLHHPFTYLNSICGYLFIIYFSLFILYYLFFITKGSRISIG